MSNPYDPYNNPGDQAPPPPPYGSYPGQGGGGSYPPSPYGSSSPYGEGPKKTDAVSITGFVLSLTCCLSIPGLILGIIGLGRTKDSQRKGRWAAIAAIPVGVVGTIILGLSIFGIVYVVQNSVTIDNAKVGQCINVTDQDNNEYSLSKKDCDSSHDAQIVVVAEVRDSAVDFGASTEADICVPLLDPADADSIDASGERVQYRVLTEDPDNPAPGDNFVCYVEKPVGNLSESLVP